VWSFSVNLQVTNHVAERVNVVMQLAERRVASLAEQAASLAGGVIVVYCQRPFAVGRLRWQTTARCAPTILQDQPGLELLGGDSELAEGTPVCLRLPLLRGEFVAVSLARFPERLAALPRGIRHCSLSASAFNSGRGHIKHGELSLQN
jgi:hypothetical protein